MVGTGGDGHDTYNVSTTAAVVAAGAGLRVAKHGSKASTSSSGSADLLMALGANIMAVGPEEVGDILATDNDGVAAGHGRFCFLYAPVFHPAMKTVAEVRRQLGLRTIFNILGPIISPIDFSTIVGAAEEMPGYESRLLGVGKRGLGPVYADTLRILGVKKALVVCGDEELDEVSIAGDTHCWRLTDSSGDVIVETFRVHPTKTFGIATHSLDLCGGGGTPAENAEIFREILDGTRKAGDPVRDFVVVNTAALLVAAGAVVGDENVGDDGVMRGTKWMGAVERVEDAIGSGRSWNMWNRFVDMSKIPARESVNGV